ncbi:mitogen-activated protein kinase kinase kinase kinase 4 isoform X2 [Syngnathus scovelli]|uniref:mitogen-activated protein kinase kinase kinase kinase 4 isoform X2 n=1 Tax=Syngnathus scovelli TaxID=161590 RepID=UPI0021101F69|nr:coiled-coil domain-containing protein 187 isoform X2 [Syngnathus scovelli]
MAELQIDQSNLPRVQEVCQSFAVLEDGVLAHNLQEQEIEQYYCSNVQKNQLVQNDIRVAKRLQDEEERRCRALLWQESRQLEEEEEDDDDYESARLILEEVRRRAQEVRRRERDDQEMAKQMQEEEELMMRRAREEERHRGSFSGACMPPLPSQHQHALSGRRPAQALYSPTTSRWHCSNTRNPPEHSRPQPPPYYPGRAFASESLHAHSDGFEQRANQRRDPAPPLHRRLSLRLPGERHGRYTPGSVAEEEYYGRADGEERQREVDRRVENGPPRAGQDGASGAAEAGERRWRRSQSVGIHHPPRRGSGDPSGTHGYRDNADKRVRFATDGGSSCRSRPPDAGVPRLWEMLGHVLRERGVPVRVGGSGAPLKISPQSPAGRPLGPSHPPHGTAFLRAASARHSFHGDIRERRSSSRRDVGERERRLDRHFSHVGGGGAGNGWARHDGGRGLADVHQDPPERIADGRRTAQEGFGSDEEAGGQRGAQRSFPRGTGSWLGWRRSAPGASLPPKKKQTSLDLGDLQQVLHDEELARKLHEQENNLLARTSRRPSRGRYPEGDFRVAQVAQDEEIAHYMQKQEMESNRTSRPLEEPTSWGEHRHHRPDRQVESEGLPSHVEDRSLASPVSTLGQSPPIQNIAEELDPTFRAKRQGADILQTEQSGGACQWLPGPRRLLEEPAFIPPTKRQKDKAKEKKEKCKQQ